MTGQTVYEAILTYLRKDKRGLSLSIDEFNTLTPLVNERIMASYCSRFEEDIESSEDLGFLKVIGSTVALSSGVGTLPTVPSYRRLIGDPYYTDTSVTPNKTRYIDVVTSKEFTYRQRDYLTQATTVYPICVIGTQTGDYKTQIRVAPTTITSIFIDYLRDPATPFLDYYITDATLAVNYMTTNTVYTVTSGTYTYRTGATGSIRSNTTDWEWDVSDLPLIVAYFLDALGVIIPDQLLLQAGMKDKSEIESQ